MKIKRKKQESVKEREIQDVKKKQVLIFLLFALISATPYIANAQCAAKNIAFQAGEKATYALYFNWKFIWAKAGYAELTTHNDTYKGDSVYKTHLIAAGTKRTDFFFVMRDTLTNYMTKQLEPIYFRKGAEEGKRYTIDEAFFSYKDGKSHVELSRTFRDGEVQKNSHQSDQCIFDMLSILAQARSYDPNQFNVGDKIQFDMATGKRVEEQTLIYRGRNVVEDENKVKYDCLVFSFVEYDDNNKEKEVITFYISNDENHLPIRLDLFLNFRSAKAFLQKIEGNKYPFTSIIKKKD